MNDTASRASMDPFHASRGAFSHEDLEQGELKSFMVNNQGKTGGFPDTIQKRRKHIFPSFF